MPQSYEEKKKLDPNSVVRAGESMTGKAGARAAGKAVRRLERKGMKRRRLGKSLTSKKRGFMSPGGALHLGKRK